MELKNFKTLRRNYGAFAAMRITICQGADVDVFTADSHLGELLDENPVGKIERMTSKQLFEIAQGIVATIKEQQKNMLSMAENRHRRFIHKIFTKQ